MIIASDIIKTYGDRKILDGASLEVKAGQCVVMTGDNGSGKTTLLHVMAGLRRPDRGEVRWKGELLTGAPGKAWTRVRENWGFMPQQVGLPLNATVRQILHYHSRLRRREMSVARQWLDRVGLSDSESKRVSELSGGMRQRLSIALMFFFEPELIIMDEPVNNLDPGWRAALAEWATEHTDRGSAILLTSQLEESWGPNTVRRHCMAGRVFSGWGSEHTETNPSQRLTVEDNR